MVAKPGLPALLPVIITIIYGQLFSETYGVVGKCSSPSLLIFFHVNVPLLPLGGGVCFLSLCIWAKPVTCFNLYNAVEVMQCDLST